MAIVYKLNILETLAKAGYTSYYLRKNKVISEATMTRLRRNEIVSLECIDRVCKLTGLQPGDLLEFVDTEE